MLTANKTVQYQAHISGAVDSHGNPADVWGDLVDVPVYGWAPPDPDSENTVGRSQTIRDLDLLAPATVSAGPNDVFVIEGDTYQVVGHPEDFTKGPFGFFPGVRINLNRSEG